MAMLGSTTTLTAEGAASALAQIDNMMQSGQKHFDRYGATVLAVGNSLATTESKIVDFSLKIAGVARIAGLTEAQVIGIAGAFGSVGIEAEAGGTAVQMVLKELTESVAMGDARLAKFAKVAGMGAQDFARLWRDDAGEAFTRFVEGLGRSGDYAFAILRDLGLSNQRLVRAFLSVGGAGDLLRRAVDLGNQAWAENTALTKAAEERFRTMAARLRMLRNQAYNLVKSLGGALAPTLEGLIRKAEGLVSSLQHAADVFARLPTPIRVVIGNLLLLLAVIGPVTIGLGLLNRTIAGVIAFSGVLSGFIGNVVFAFTSWRLGAATLGEAFVYCWGQDPVAHNCHCGPDRGLNLVDRQLGGG